MPRLQLFGKDIDIFKGRIQSTFLHLPRVTAYVKDCTGVCELYFNPL